jgi:hypothetical protein
MSLRAKLGLGLALPAGLALLLTVPGWAQQPQPAVLTEPIAPAGGEATSPASPPSDPMLPANLVEGPSLKETGKIAVAPVPPAMNLIEGQDSFKSPTEKSIAPAASNIDSAPSRPRGVINPRVLDKEIGERFADISACRVDVARLKQVMPSQVVADKLMLRWIIQPDGTTISTEVVAIAPVDLGIMDCAKRVMSQWTFTRPRGGPLPVERPFQF